MPASATPSEGPVADESAKPGHRAGFLGLPPGHGRRDTGAERNSIAPNSCTKKAPSRKRTWKWPKTPTRKPRSRWRPPWNTCACWAPTSIIPSSIVELHAPVSGVITDQHVTDAAGMQGLASPNPFTISDLSHVWIICDVYENDLSFVRTGEFADIHSERLSEPGAERRVRRTFCPCLIPISAPPRSGWKWRIPA